MIRILRTFGTLATVAPVSAIEPARRWRRCSWSETTRRRTARRLWLVAGQPPRTAQRRHTRSQRPAGDESRDRVWPPTRQIAQTLLASRTRQIWRNSAWPPPSWRWHSSASAVPQDLAPPRHAVVSLGRHPKPAIDRHLKTGHHT